MWVYQEEFDPPDQAKWFFALFLSGKKPVQ
jgi:hypothetical protein